MCKLKEDMSEDAAVSIMVQNKFGSESLSDVPILDKDWGSTINVFWFTGVRPPFYVGKG